jgi:hypothetical protein
VTGRSPYALLALLLVGSSCRRCARRSDDPHAHRLRRGGGGDYLYDPSRTGGLGRPEVEEARSSASATAIIPHDDTLNLRGTSGYWTNEYGINQSTVMRVPVGGGDIVPMASGQADLGAIAVDATSVYWATNGTISKLSK